MRNKEKIFAKILSGNASESEHQKLNHWLNESESNKLEFDQASKLWERTQYLKKENQHDVDLAWEKFKSSTENESVVLRPLPRYRNLKIAAAIALFLVFGFLIKINLTENVRIVPTVSENVTKFAQPESIGILTEIEEIDTLFNLSEIKAKPVSKRSYKKKYFKDENITIITTGDSARAFLLPDNTIVFLNANSQLEYMSNFSQQNRHVTLIGEGYFQVPQDSGLFSVDCENTIVRSNFGSFNIKSYKTDLNVEVIVASGIVEFSGIGTKDFKILSLNAGESAVYTKQKDTFIKNTSARKNYKWWQKSFRMKIKNFFDKLLGRTPSPQVINQVK